MAKPSPEKIEPVQSLAVKYRPMTFDDVVGQDSTVDALRGMLKRKRMTNALLFAGASGSGKTTLARLVARYVNCETMSACGTCASCRTVQHPDVFELNGAVDRGIDAVRNLLRSAALKPRHNLRVFIIDEAQGLTPEARGALLMPMEQPPKSTMYILCTTDPQKLPDAIMTRVTRFNVAEPTVKDIALRLRSIAKQEGTTVDKEYLLACSRGSGGSLRSAINLLERCINELSSNPKAKSEDVIRIIESSAQPADLLVCFKILIGMYNRNPRPVVSAIFDLSAHGISTANQLLWLNEFVLGTMVESGRVWWKPENKQFLGLVKAKTKLDLDTALAVQMRLTDLRAELSQFGANEKSVMLKHLGPKCL